MASLAREGGIPERSQTGDCSRPIPASFHQDFVWRRWSDEARLPGKRILLAWRLSGRVDHDALEAAVHHLAARHEALRTVFQVCGGHLHQVIRTATHAVEFQSESLETGDGATRDDAWLAVLQRERRAPFDIFAGPLLRARVLRFGHERHILLLIVHHLAADGSSMSAIAHDLTAAYSCDTAALGRVRQFRELVAHQRRVASGELDPDQRAYWEKTLAGIAVDTDVPVARDPSAVTTDYWKYVPFHRLPAGASFAAQAARLGATPTAIFVAAAALAVNSFGRRDELMLLLVWANRRTIGMRTVGCCYDHLPLRVRFTGGASLKRFTKHVMVVIASAIANGEVSYLALPLTSGADLVNCGLPGHVVVNFLDRGRVPQRVPLGEAVWEAIPGAELGGDPPVRERHRLGPFISFDGYSEADRLSGVLGFNSDIVASDVSRLLAVRFERFLEAIVAHPELPLSAATADVLGSARMTDIRMRGPLP